MFRLFGSQKFSRGTVISLLLFLLIVAFVIRFFASSLPGHGSDLGINAGWAHSGAQLGLGESYKEQLYDNILPNHPPISIISYTLVGKLYLDFVNDSENTGFLAHSIWIRLPAIAADLLTLLLLFILLFEWKGIVAAFIGGFIQAFHPAVILDSAIWGQIDSVFTMFIFASLLCHARKWWVMFAVCYTLAILAKAQALAIAPLMLYLWLQYVPWKHKVLSLLFSCATAGVILSPFIFAGTFPEVLRTYTDAVGYFSALSMNAYNLWWLLYDDPSQSSTTPALLWLSYRQIGLILFFVSQLYFIYVYHRYRTTLKTKKSTPDFFPLFVVAVMIYLAFFLLNTEMHERYLFPAVVLAIPIAFKSWKYALAYVSLSLLFLLNLLGAFSVSPIDRWLFESFVNLRTLVAFLLVLLFIYLWKLVRIDLLPSRIKKNPSKK